MTPRQVKLLHAIIDDFINSATAVGSLSLTHRYNLGVSPATIRNEMSDLVDQGYLEKPHSSSGRIPTNMAYRYFIHEILHELDDLEHTLTANIYEELFQHRFDFDDLIYQALSHLSSQTKNTALVLLENRIYYSGLSYLANNPEFSESKSMGLLLSILENKQLLNKVFQRAKSTNNVKIIIGEDSGIEGLKDVAFVFSEINLHGDKKGFLAICGPTRLNYPRAVSYTHLFLTMKNYIKKQ